MRRIAPVAEDRFTRSSLREPRATERRRDQRPVPRHRPNSTWSLRRPNGRVPNPASDHWRDCSEYGPATRRPAKRRWPPADNGTSDARRTLDSRYGRAASSPGQARKSVWDYPRAAARSRRPRRSGSASSSAGTTVADSTSNGQSASSETARRARLLYFHARRRPDGPLRREPRADVLRVEGRGELPRAGRRRSRRSRTLRGPTRTLSRAMRRSVATSRSTPAKGRRAWVGDERATPQPGGFYGGWVTSRIVGQ